VGDDPRRNFAERAFGGKVRAGNEETDDETDLAPPEDLSLGCYLVSLHQRSISSYPSL
jgi:hypothetical protein